MKKSILLFFMAVIMAMSGTASAEMLEPVQHNKWMSFILTDGKRTVTRISTQSASVSSTLVLNFASGNCGFGIPQIIFSANGVPNGSSVPISGSLRIDQKPIKPFTGEMSAENGFFFINIHGIDGYSMLRDAMTGTTVRIKIDGGQSGQDIYERYSLMGFTAAYNRAQKLCSVMGNSAPQQYYNPDAQYFNDAPSNNGRYGTQDPDAVYF